MGRSDPDNTDTCVVCIECANNTDTRVVCMEHYRTEGAQNSQGGLNTVYHPENAWVYFF